MDPAGSTIALSGLTLVTRREALVGAASSLAASSAFAIAAAPASGAVRKEIGTLAADKARLASLEGAVKEMQERSRKDPKDPKGWLVNANPPRRSARSSRGRLRRSISAGGSCPGTGRT